MVPSLARVLRPSQSRGPILYTDKQTNQPSAKKNPLWRSSWKRSRPTNVTWSIFTCSPYIEMILTGSLLHLFGQILFRGVASFTVWYSNITADSNTLIYLFLRSDVQSIPDMKLRLLSRNKYRCCLWWFVLFLLVTLIAPQTFLPVELNQTRSCTVLEYLITVSWRRPALMWNALMSLCAVILDMR